MTSLAQASGVNPFRYDFLQELEDEDPDPGFALRWAKEHGRLWQAGYRGQRTGLVMNQQIARRRDWVSAPGRSFSGRWDSPSDSCDITDSPRRQDQDSRPAQASTSAQQVAIGAVQRQVQGAEQPDVEQREPSRQYQLPRQLWASGMKAARARVKNLKKASVEEVKKKPIATMGVVAAVIALVYTVASHAN